VSDDEYVEEIRIVRRKKDTYRSNSSKSDEFESDLLRDKRTKNVAGPTESRSVDEEELRQKYQGDPIFLTPDSVSIPTQRREPTPTERAMADAIVELGAVVLRDFVAPLVREVALPAAKAKLSEFAERRRLKALERAEARARALETRVVELEVTVDVESAPASADVTVAEPTIAMSRSDLLLAELQLKLAEDYAARQRWLIAHAEVTDENLAPELEQAIIRILEGNANELDDDQREAVAVFLERVHGTAHGQQALHIRPEGDEEV